MVEKKKRERKEIPGLQNGLSGEMNNEPLATW